MESDRDGRASHGVQSQLLDVRKAEDLEPAFPTASKHAPMGWLWEETSHDCQSESDSQLAAMYRLPAIYRSELIEPGAQW